MTAKALLGVERSFSGRRWTARLSDERQAAAVAQRHDLPDVLARILVARHIGLDEAEAYLNPTIRTLMPDPSVLRDMDKGADLIAAAIMKGKSIGIITDYDVDGVCSAALLSSFLKQAGSGPCIIRVPDRLTEGYGPSTRAVEELQSQGIDLLLTLDCGVLAHDPLAHAAALGLTSVIVDHHQAGEQLPDAAAVINPNRQDDVSGLGYLCAAGVTMILVIAINRKLRSLGWYNEMRLEPNMLRWLDLVALATICDVVPLTGLNRAFVIQGLKVMARRANVGLSWLADMARLKRGPDAYALGFVIGPRINAAGRVGHAAAALELLRTEDPVRAQQLAQQLEQMNRQRQEIEARVLEAALLQSEAALGKEQKANVIVAAGEGWHPGVVGLAASRLKERYRRPAFALSMNRATGLATGSARSIAGADVGTVVRHGVEMGLLLKGGGHAMAAGLTLENARLGEFREFLEMELGPRVDLLAEAQLAVDACVSASGVTLDLIEIIEQAGPYGSGNPAPMIALPSHYVRYAEPVGRGHIRCTVEGGGVRLKAIAFRAMGSELGEALLSERQMPLHIAARLTVDEWGAKRVPALHIEDMALPT